MLGEGRCNVETEPGQPCSLVVCDNSFICMCSCTGIPAVLQHQALSILYHAAACCHCCLGSKVRSV